MQGIGNAMSMEVLSWFEQQQLGAGKARQDDGRGPKWRPWQGRQEAVDVCLGMLPKKRGGKVSAATTGAEVPNKVAKSGAYV
jgi:hypothetical protein